MLYASVLLIILIIGLLLYALATNPKVQELGRLAYACSLLAICLQLGGRMLSLLR